MRESPLQQLTLFFLLTLVVAVAMAAPASSTSGSKQPKSKGAEPKADHSAHAVGFIDSSRHGLQVIRESLKRQWAQGTWTANQAAEGLKEAARSDTGWWSVLATLVLVALCLVAALLPLAALVWCFGDVGARIPCLGARTMDR